MAVNKHRTHEDRIIQSTTANQSNVLIYTRFLYTLGVTYIDPKLYILSKPSTLPSARLKQNNLTSRNCLSVYKMTDRTRESDNTTYQTKSSVCDIVKTDCTYSAKLWHVDFPDAARFPRLSAAFLLLTTRVF